MIPLSSRTSKIIPVTNKLDTVHSHSFLSVSRKVLLVTILFLNLLIGVPHSALANDEQKLEIVKREIQQLEQWLKDARNDYSDLDKALRKSDRDIANLVNSIEVTKQKLQEEQDRLKKLREEQKSLRNLQNQQTSKLAAQVREAYRLGQSHALKLWLSEDDPNKIQRTVRYFDYFNKARADEIKAVVKHLDQLANIESIIAQQNIQLKTTQTDLEKRRSALANQRQRQKDLLAKLDSQLNTEALRLKKKQADQKRLIKLLKETAELVRKSPRKINENPFNKMKGKLPLPLKGRVLNAYGGQNSSTMSRWDGWQISATQGAAIKAIHHGRVVYADWLRGYGLLIILDHGDGYLSLYAHNETLNKSVGSWVNSGDIIASAGISGGMESPRLYFEIRHKGVPKDPAVWLNRR